MFSSIILNDLKKMSIKTVLTLVLIDINIIISGWLINWLISKYILYLNKISIASLLNSRIK